MALFEGCGVALVTPFDELGKVNFGALEKLLCHVTEGGVNALIACGTTGEPSAMTQEEREQVISYCVKFACGKIPVLAGSGGNNTQDVVKFSRRCEELGADGLLVVTPYYNKCTQQGAYLHYKTISDSVHIPIVAYNVPGRTGFNLLPETVEKLSDLKNVRGIKEASGNVEQLLEVARRVYDKMHIYSGDDNLTVPAMAVGAQGVVSVAANVIPRQMCELTQLCRTGNYLQAAKRTYALSPFMKRLFCEVNPIPCKKALQLLGIDVGLPRLPLTELEPEHTDLLRADMHRLGLIG